MLVGNVNLGLGDTDEAMEMYQRALTLAQDNRSTFGECKAYCCIGNCHYARKELKEAAQQYKKALLLAEGSHFEVWASQGTSQTLPPLNSEKRWHFVIRPVPPPPPILCLTVECITSGLHLSVS